MAMGNVSVVVSRETAETFHRRFPSAGIDSALSDDQREFRDALGAALAEEESAGLRKALRTINGHIGVSPSNATEAAIRATIEGALGLEPGEEWPEDFMVEHDYGDGFQRLLCGPTCYRYTPPDGGDPQESHGTFDGRGCSR